MNTGRRLVVMFLGVAAVAGGIWWALGQRAAPKTPASVPIDDPAVASAVAASRDAVIGRPDDAALWGRLGQTYLANGFSDPAHECFVEAARLDPEEPRWPYLEGISLLLRDPAAALACWQRAAECPGSPARTEVARLRWAESLFQNNRGAEAEAIFRAIVNQQPQNIRAHLGLGLIAQSRNDDAEAIAHFRLCTETPFSRLKALSGLAAAYSHRGEKALAEESARRAEHLPPDQRWPDPMMEDLIPFTVGLNGLRTQAGFQQQEGNARQAILILRHLIGEYPADGQSYAQLGMILVENGEFAEAEQVLRSGLQIAPDLVQAHYSLAVSLYYQAQAAGFSSAAGRSKLEEAEREARRAVELKPDHGFAHLYRGLALRQLGKNPEGLASLREAARCTPDSPDTHLRLGEALWDEQKSQEGIEELRTAARLSSPNDHRAEKILERIGGKE